MKTKTLAISILLLAIVLTPLAMGAEDRAPRPRGPRDGQGPAAGPRGEFRGGPGMGGDLLLGRMSEQLNLTEEQKAQIQTIQEENRPQMQEARQALQKANQTLQEAIENGTDDQIVAAGKALGEAYGKQGVVRAQAARKVKAILTPEQVKKMEELRTQMRERMQQRLQEGQAGDRPRRGAAGEGGRQGREGQGGGRRAPQD